MCSQPKLEGRDRCRRCVWTRVSRQRHAHTCAYVRDYARPRLAISECVWAHALDCVVRTRAHACARPDTHTRAPRHARAGCTRATDPRCISCGTVHCAPRSTVSRSHGATHRSNWGKKKLCLKQDPCFPGAPEAAPRLVSMC